MTEVTITHHDPHLDTDEELAELVAFGNFIRAVVLPDDPPQEVGPTIAANRALPPRLRRWSFRARTADGALVAVGSCRIDPDHDDNPDLLDLSINVHPDHRRHGTGQRLLGELVQVAAADGRSRLVGHVVGSDAGGTAFAEAVGGERRYAEHLNHLPVAEVDRPLMERWAVEGRAPTPACTT